MMIEFDFHLKRLWFSTMIMHVSQKRNIIIRKGRWWLVRSSINVVNDDKEINNTGEKKYISVHRPRSSQRMAWPCS